MRLNYVRPEDKAYPRCGAARLEEARNQGKHHGALSAVGGTKRELFQSKRQKTEFSLVHAGTHAMVHGEIEGGTLRASTGRGLVK